MTPGRPALYDFEYERHGVCALFMVNEPLRGWRKVVVMLVKLRLRLLGPLASMIRQPNTSTAPRSVNSVDSAYREVDTALDHLSAALARPWVEPGVQTSRNCGSLTLSSYTRGM